MRKPDCRHAMLMDRGTVTCALGRFGGFPHIGTCRACLAGAIDANPHKAAPNSLRGSRRRPDICPHLVRSCCGRANVCGLTGAEVDGGDCQNCTHPAR
ncbi:MAG: hypothetical protein J7M14_02915 [Planctomycetes bacterium]|nr:hypothetical protein [Planctomycetota bacterium]